MTLESALVFGFLLFVAAAAGYFFARRPLATKSHSDKPGQDYFRGLSYLVDEQPDKAIEVFVNLLSIDSETLETHFALGSLFRRRGETERAIRIHQNIIARPELDKSHRERALFALAEDYLKAGLFDRAENLFNEVTDSLELRIKALRNLLSIYEQQQDWQQAIDCQQKLRSVPGAISANVAAHYYCELANEALTQDDSSSARKHIRKARSIDADCVRATLMRASIAGNDRDYRLQRKLLRHVIGNMPQFATVVLPKLAESYASSGDKDEFPSVLEKLLSASPGLSRPIAHAAILDRRMDDRVSLSCLKDYVESDRILGAILEALEADRAKALSDSESGTLRRIRLVLRRLALDGPRFECHECGFASRSMEWHCPSCQSWDSTLPTASLEFVSHLHAPE